MDDNFYKSLIDYYTPEELVDLLELNDDEYRNLVHCLEDVIEERIEKIREDMNYE